jgi:hypothetical protein
MLNLQIIGEVVFRGLCLRDDSEETHHHGQENLAAARGPEVASQIVFATITFEIFGPSSKLACRPCFGNCCNIAIELKTPSMSEMVISTAIAVVLGGRG